MIAPDGWNRQCPSSVFGIPRPPHAIFEIRGRQTPVADCKLAWEARLPESVRSRPTWPYLCEMASGATHSSLHR